VAFVGIPIHIYELVGGTTNALLRRFGLQLIHSFIHIRLFSVVKTQPNMN